MSPKEQLWYLIDGLLDGNYDINNFCDEFTRIFDLEVEYDTLNSFENKEFLDLSEMTARFSDNEEDLKLPNVYFDEQQVRKKVEEIKKSSL